MDPAVEEGRCRLEQSAGEDDDAGGAVTDLVVLRFRQFDEELCDLVFDLHLAHDGRAVVGDGDVAVGRDHDLVEAARAEAGLDDVADCPRGEDVRLERLDPVQSGLFTLVADDNLGCVT